MEALILNLKNLLPVMLLIVLASPWPTSAASSAQSGSNTSGSNGKTKKVFTDEDIKVEKVPGQ